MSRKQKSAGHEERKPLAQGHGGKLENDSNKTGQQEPRQVNEGKRTPESRHDRQTLTGTVNQVRVRKGGGGGAGNVGGWH
ncbi:MAG: hypothetical protein V4731_05085 [Pseudomonadota bacterium]